jgi:hypothetical protein
MASSQACLKIGTRALETVCTHNAHRDITYLPRNNDVWDPRSSVDNSPPCSTKTRCLRMPFPVELEADTALADLPLLSTNGSQTRNLLVYRDHLVPENLRLTEKAVSSTPTRNYEHYNHYTFSIQRDIAVPLYTVTLRQQSQPEWAIEVICRGKPLVFSFGNRQDALKLQRFLTGYEVKDSFFGTETLARLEGSLWKFRSRSEHHGMAEIQLWEWPNEPRGTAQLSPMTTRSSQGQTPPASIAPSENSFSDAVTVQRDHSTGRQAVVTELTPPPLVVMFLQESNRYTMLSIDGKQPVEQRCPLGSELTTPQ